MPIDSEDGTLPDAPASTTIHAMQTTTTVRRRRAPPKPPLTLDTFAIEVRGKFTVMDARLAAQEAASRAQTDGQAAALRIMIAEEVDARLEIKLAALKDDLKADLHAMLDPIVDQRAQDKDVFIFVRREIRDRKVRIALEAERRDNFDGLVVDLRQSALGIAGLVLAGKAQTQWGLPWWEFWPVAIFIAVTCIVWPFYKNLLKPRNRRITDAAGRPATQAHVDAESQAQEDIDSEVIVS